MTLMEHLIELRSRLMRATVAVAVGFIVGLWLAKPVLGFLERPYCRLTHEQGQKCGFVQLAPTDSLFLNVKIALWLALILAAPIWLYQLWAFIAPGLHRRERRWAYWFAGVAAPLFAAGGVLAYLVISKGLAFLLQFNGPNVTNSLEITRYIDFITGLMLLFGVAFEFPLVVVLFNMAGLASGRKLLGWWRTAVFLMFAFAAIATPTADPFGMTFLGLSLAALYFGAVGFAFVNDKRRARRQAAEDAELGMDTAALRVDHAGAEPIEAGRAGGFEAPAQRASTRRYDDST
jgi:sec-independent protein translocase protein TatC